MVKSSLVLSFLVLAGGGTASAQLISIRTVPVSQSHQFDIFPSTTLPMGGVSIAVADSMLDPFTNPATGSRLGTTRFLGSPSVYSVSSNAGGGRTLPLGGLTRTGDWHGGVWVAIQEVDLSENPFRFTPGPVCPACTTAVDPAVFARTHANRYAFASLGRALSDEFSIGGSVRWSQLNAIDGVDLLYAGAAGIGQAGHAVDLRLGMLKEWAGGTSFEAVALHHRLDATHDVYYFDGFWDPGLQQFAVRPRLEQNLDRTNVWGLHAGFRHRLGEPGWRMGWIATVNRMDHPKIPNYEIMNIPRDPGNSSAFNVGLGVARSLATSTFGMDLIFEPIWSHTWADAEGPVQNARGGTIPAGGMTIENRFRFANARFRIGLDQVILAGSSQRAALQLGLAVNSIHYWLDQQDHVQLTSRKQEERWTERTPSWGMSLRFSDQIEVRYRGSLTSGTGRPGIFGSNVVAVPDAGINILAAPSGPLTLTGVTITTHQVSLSVPLH